MNENSSRRHEKNVAPLRVRARDLLERILPWLVLALLARYTYALFFQVPYIGFAFEFPSGRIVELYVDDRTLRPGDGLLQVGSLSLAEFTQPDPNRHFFQDARPGQKIPVTIGREGREVTVLWSVPGFSWVEGLERFSSSWWLAYVFWMGGTFALLLIRPRDDRWRLLTAFNYLTAIWLAAGTGSAWNIGWSRGVFRAAVWLSVPVALHLHWVFPDPLPRFPRWFRYLGYLLAGIIAAGELFHLLPTTFYWYGFLLVLGGSALIVLWRLIYRPEQRAELGLLLGAILLVLIPPAVMAAAFILDLSPSYFVASVALLALPAVPGAYFYILFRRQLGRRRARARRLVRIYVGSVMVSALFFLLFAGATTVFQLEASPVAIQLTILFFFGIGAILGFAPFFSLAALADPPRSRQDGGDVRLRLRANRLLIPFFFVMATLLLLALTLLLLIWFFDEQFALLLTAILGVFWGRFGYRPLERAVDRYLLGIRLPPSNLLEGFAERITTTLDRESLRRLLRDEVLPSLLVRQSALLHVRESGKTELILGHGVEPLAQCEHRQLPHVPLGTGQQPLPEAIPSWVRLVTPLRLNQRIVGCWLWGARDPDDLYRPQDVRTLQALADQTAIALTNILQAENLRALYRTHIDGREQERTRLALALHDEILNELAVLNMYVDQAGEPFYEAYDRVRARLRDTISDLRPAMLNYGLATALEELVDDLDRRTPEGVRLLLALEPADGRYSAQVESHLFRIVQQALENALKHAQATTIRLEGKLAAGAAELAVIDDGVGFPRGETLSLPTLLAQKHFGLVGMYERAGLIGAEVAIFSDAGGTRVVVRWPRRGTPPASE